MYEIKISVIIPIYNVRDYLEECLDSVERQSISDIEVILVNDGSTDGSEEICHKYVEKDDRFFIVNKKNGGLSSARNKGLEYAKGEYVYFLDSDDYIADDALEILYNKIKGDDLDVLMFSSNIIDENGNKADDSYPNGYLYKGHYPEIYDGTNALKLLMNNGDNGIVSCCLFLVRKEIIQSNNMVFFEGIVFEDVLFHFELLSCCRRVGIIEDTLYYRRMREGSITQSGGYITKLISICTIVKQTEDFINDNTSLEECISNSYMRYFISLVLGIWDSMGIREKCHRDTRRTISSIKRIVTKYHYGDSLAIRFLFINPLVCEVYLRLKRTYQGLKDI